MLSVISGWCCSCWISSNVNNCLIPFKSFQNIIKSWLNKCPCTLVFRLFLNPHYFSILIFFHFILNLLKWEWTYLFNSTYSNIIFRFVLTSLIQIVINLSRTENNSFNFRWIYQINTIIRNYFFKSQRFSKVFNIWASVFES